MVLSEPVRWASAVITRSTQCALDNKALAHGVSESPLFLMKTLLQQEQIKTISWGPMNMLSLILP